MTARTDLTPAVVARRIGGTAKVTRVGEGSYKLTLRLREAILGNEATEAFRRVILREFPTAQIGGVSMKKGQRYCPRTPLLWECQFTLPSGGR